MDSSIHHLIHGEHYKHELHPMNAPIGCVCSVVPGDVLANESQFPDLDFDANLLQTLASNGSMQRFTGFLSAARQNVPFASFVWDGGVVFIGFCSQSVDMVFGSSNRPYSLKNFSSMLLVLPLGCLAMTKVALPFAA